MHPHALHSPKQGYGYGTLGQYPLEGVVLGTFPALIPAYGGFLLSNPLGEPLSHDIAVMPGSTLG